MLEVTVLIRDNIDRNPLSKINFIRKRMIKNACK